MDVPWAPVVVVGFCDVSCAGVRALLSLRSADPQVIVSDSDITYMLPPSRSAFRFSGPNSPSVAPMFARHFARAEEERPMVKYHSLALILKYHSLAYT